MFRKERNSYSLYSCKNPKKIKKSLEEINPCKTFDDHFKIGGLYLGAIIGAASIGIPFTLEVGVPYGIAGAIVGGMVGVVGGLVVRSIVDVGIDYLFSNNLEFMGRGEKEAVIKLVQEFSPDYKGDLVSNYEVGS